MKDHSKTVRKGRNKHKDIFHGIQLADAVRATDAPVFSPKLPKIKKASRVRRQA